MTKSEYWAEIKSLADETVRACRDGEVDDLHDYLHERIDGHSYVIYTRENHDVIRWTENEDYTAREFGADSLVRDGSIHWALIAYGAMYGDLTDELCFYPGFDINDPDSWKVDEDDAE